MHTDEIDIHILEDKFLKVSHEKLIQLLEEISRDTEQKNFSVSTRIQIKNPKNKVRF